MIRYGVPAAVIVCVSACAATAPRAPAPRGAAFFAATVADLEASAQWYVTYLGTRRVSSSHAPSGIGETVVLANDFITAELIQFTESAPSDTVLRNLRSIGLKKTGVWVPPATFDALFQRLGERGATFVGGIIEDKALQARSFIVEDNSAILLQFFTPIS